MTDTLTKRGGYSLETDLRPIIDGKVALPNAKPVDSVAAKILHYREMRSGTAVEAGGEKHWNARFFLDYGQGGQLYGSGVAAWVEYESAGYEARAVSFAICEHDQKEGSGANHIRGWHPAFCAKCGLDMSIDSGD